MAKYVLSDPNFSDGTRKDVIEQIIGQFRDKPGLKLIGYEPDRRLRSSSGRAFGNAPSRQGGPPRCFRQSL